MAFCVKCGVRVAEGEQYCAACDVKSNPTAACFKCGTPYSSPNAKFCMVCGASRQTAQAPPPVAETPPPPPSAHRPTPEVRAQQPPVNPQAATAPAPASPTQHTVCPQCGKAIKVGQAKFCIYCAAPLPASPPPSVTPEPSPISDAPSVTEPEAKHPLSTEQQSLVEAETQKRFDVYRTIGRQVLSICHGNQAVKDGLPSKLAGEIDQAAEAIQNGHSRLAKAGICPRCQDTALSPDNGRCPVCGLTIAR